MTLKYICFLSNLQINYEFERNSTFIVNHKLELSMGNSNSQTICDEACAVTLHCVFTTKRETDN